MLINVELLVATLADVQGIIASRVSRKLASLGNRMDVDDLIQEVQLRAFQALGQCHAETNDEFRHWVLTIARNTCESLITCHRGVQKRSTRREECAIGVSTDESRDGFQPADRSVDPAVQVEVAETLALEAAELESLIGQLSKWQKAAISLKFLSQMENDEVAAELGLTTAAVRNLISRGLESLRALMIA